MVALDEFQSLLKEVVQPKRLSASKMNKLTEIAMKSMEEDTQLVSILYRTHKSLAPAGKVSSLYVFDALARAAKSHAHKHNLTGDAHSEKGNTASFLVKIEGVLDGLIQDMASTDIPEAKEKTKKILDIWAKGNTFTAPVIARLKDLIRGSSSTEQVSEPTKPHDPRPTTAAVPKVSPPPTSQPQPHQPAPPPLPQQPLPPAAQDAQATLLALLSRAVASNPVAAGQTQANNEPAPPATQLAILQQLAQTAKLSTDNANHVPNNSHPAPVPNGQYPPYQSSYPPAEHDSRFDQRRQYDDRPNRPPRGGGFRGGYRGRGRGGDGWRDDRGDRFKERDWSQRQRHSRSRSPPSRHQGGGAASRRDIKPYSPPRRPSIVAHQQENSADKDEFGRDLRPQSPAEDEGDALKPQPPPPSVPVPASVMGIVETTTTPSSNPPVSTSIAANTSMSPAAPASTNNDASQPGLESFNIASFDFTSAASWEALGSMWQVTNGEIPSTEQLMQFVLSFGAGQQQQQQQWGGVWGGDNSNSWDNNDHAYQGGGGRKRGPPRAHWNQYDETDAIVLGSGDEDYEQQTDVQPENQPHTPGGSMQRVGDKWMFVRDPAVGVT